MKNTSKTLIFFGNERLVSGLKTNDAPILAALIENGYNIAAVVSHHTKSRSRNNRELEVARVASTHNIPVLLPDNPNDIVDELKKLHADAGVLVAYGKMIPQNIIDVFPIGIINIHPSLLPQYRGPTPIETCIENGDDKTGVSIMQLSSKMDEGPVYVQSHIPLSGTATKFDLYDIVARKSVELLLANLPEILDGTLQAKPQDDNKATYTKLLSKADSILDTTVSAATCERLVRAHLGFPKTKTRIMDHEITILNAHVSSEKNTILDIRCSDGLFLSIDELVAPSGRIMSSQAFLNGYAAD